MEQGGAQFVVVGVFFVFVFVCFFVVVFVFCLFAFSDLMNFKVPYIFVFHLM